MIIAPLQGDLVATLVSGTDTPIFAIDTDFDAPEKLSFIGIGQAEAAADGGVAAVELAKKAGWQEIKAICIAGVQGDSTAEGRKNGYQQGIEQAGGTFLVDEIQYADAVADKAVSSMEGIMQNHPEGIAIICCHNDDCAMAAARAAQGNEAFKNTVFVGFDGNSTACQSVLDGVETMTVAQGGYEQGYSAVEAAVKTLNGEQVDSFINCGTEVITKDNAQARLDKLTEQLGGSLDVLNQG
jgi:ribose transport system substrate-binding protein